MEWLEIKVPFDKDLCEQQKEEVSQTYMLRFLSIGLCPQCKSRKLDEAINVYRDDDTIASIDVYCKNCGYTQHFYDTYNQEIKE